MIELLSPNVTFISNSLFESELSRTNIQSTQIHTINNERVWVIDSYSRNEVVFNRSVEKTFDVYSRNDALYNVNKTGLPDHNEKGSERFCTNSSTLATYLTDILVQSQAIPKYVDGTAFKGVTEYFRFMRYYAGGEHFPHYDSDFEMPESTTRLSLIAYFTNNETGELAFVDDSKYPESFDEVVTKGSDWKRQATESEILLKIKPRVGRIVVFPHSLCHTVLPFTPENKNETRIIARGDVAFWNKDIKQ